MSHRVHLTIVVQANEDSALGIDDPLQYDYQPSAFDSDEVCMVHANILKTKEGDIECTTVVFKSGQEMTATEKLQVAYKRIYKENYPSPK